MKKVFWISLITLFTLAAASLLFVQYTQMRRTVEVSDNLFNISVNNAMDDMIEQLNRLKVEDYISQNDRYKLLKFKRIDELNERMQDIVKQNYSVFYDTTLVRVGITMIDSVILLPGATVSHEDSSAIASYNSVLATRDRLLNSPDFYNQFVTDISEYVVDNIMTSNTFNFTLLDSLITDKLMLNGVDIAPYILVAAPQGKLNNLLRYQSVPRHFHSPVVPAIHPRHLPQRETRPDEVGLHQQYDPRNQDPDSDHQPGLRDAARPHRQHRPGHQRHLYRHH